MHRDAVGDDPGVAPVVPLRSSNRRGRATRERILAAATGELARHGLDLSVDDVARAAGTTRMTVYRHFGTREDLLTTLLLEEAQRLLVEVRPILESPAPFAERLGEAIVHVVATVRASPHLHAIVARTNPGEAWPQVDPDGRFVAMLWESLRPYLEAARTEVAFRADVDRTLDWLLRQVLGLLVVVGIHGPGDAAVRADVDTFILPAILRP